MKIAVLGYGTVGSGVVKTLNINKSSISQKSDNGVIEVKYILDIKEIADENAHLLVKDINTIISDDEVKVVVETMGGLHPAFEFVSACLEKGKSVVTSNKELVAQKGLELMKTAKANNCMFEFEASVGGGIPIIRAITDSLNSNQITDIAGIINGTTNFILTKMIKEGLKYDTVLKTAQEKGYAEKDPTADVEGLDACRKICILSALAFSKHIYPENVHTEGISSIRLQDVEYADKLGYVVKLIARAKKDGDRLEVMVSPALVSKESPLAFVNDVNNGVLVRGNAVNEIMLYGPGAGMMPTASAVVSDVIDVCNKYGKESKMFWEEEAEGTYIKDYLECKTRFFVCICPDIEVNNIKEIFGDVEINSDKEQYFITKEETEKELRKKLSSFGDKVKSALRVVTY